VAAGRKARTVSVSADWCHICGLPIPDTIVCGNHPLYGTIDHVVPMSRGGVNVLSNRRAAHGHCNKIKAHYDLESVDRYSLQGRIKALLATVGIVITHQMMQKARQRINIPAITNHGKGANFSKGKPLSIQRWDDDGGFRRGKQIYRNIAFLESP
jgi:hypothetical protein